MTTITEGAKQWYLQMLDTQLQALSNQLSNAQNISERRLLKVFGDKEGWDWSRLPTQIESYSTIADMVDNIRQELHWFHWHDSETPEESKGYFTALNIEAESGLPQAFEYIDLHRLQRDAPKLLEQFSTFEQGSERVRQLLTGDSVSPDTVRKTISQYHEDAMRRNYLEQLIDAQLLPIRTNEIRPFVTKRKVEGGESLWNIALITYSKSMSMHHIVMFDVWQDIRPPFHIVDHNNGTGSISNTLKDAMKFAPELSCSYLIQNVDKKFHNLHPVHATRALLGPFDTRYLRNDLQLPVAYQIEGSDGNAAFLRCSIQYAYAPNHFTVGDNIRQKVYDDDWRDEIIVSPSEYSSTVAKSVDGDKVRVIEA